MWVLPLQHACVLFVSPTTDIRCNEVFSMLSHVSQGQRNHELLQPGNFRDHPLSVNLHH